MQEVTHVDLSPLCRPWMNVLATLLFVPSVLSLPAPILRQTLYRTHESLILARALTEIAIVSMFPYRNYACGSGVICEHSWQATCHCTVKNWGLMTLLMEESVVTILMTVEVVTWIERWFHCSCCCALLDPPVPRLCQDGANVKAKKGKMSNITLASHSEINREVDFKKTANPKFN